MLKACAEELSKRMSTALEGGDYAATTEVWAQIQQLRPISNQQANLHGGFYRDGDYSEVMIPEQPLYSVTLYSYHIPLDL